MSRAPEAIRERLNLRREQEKTLTTPTLKANFILKAMFLTFDLLYGRKCTLPKVKVLEVLARYPYWAWEDGAYLALSKLYAATDKVDPNEVQRLLAKIDLSRSAQDNEQWHLLLLEDILQQRNIKLGWFSHVLLPRLMAFTYYFLTRAIYLMNPVWSYQMNAAFESHAEHEYMKMAKEHPEWDNEPIDSAYFKYYPHQHTLGDLVRRIGLDERDHMNESLHELAAYRKTQIH